MNPIGMGGKKDTNMIQKPNFQIDELEDDRPAIAKGAYEYFNHNNFSYFYFLV
jgi:hypothetical protein